MMFHLDCSLTTFQVWVLFSLDVTKDNTILDLKYVFGSAQMSCICCTIWLLNTEDLTLKKSKEKVCNHLV